MQKDFYDRLARPYEEDKKKGLRLMRVNDWITKAFYVVYPVLLVVLLLMRDPRVLRVILVPAISFVAVTVFRKKCNAPRPYEVWDTPPLIPKDTKGNSFPSRHVFSLYMITMAVAYVCWPVAIPLAIVGVFLAWARVVGRVHFVKDVLAGALIAVAVGVVCFFLI